MLSETIDVDGLKVFRREGGPHFDIEIDCDLHSKGGIRTCFQ